MRSYWTCILATTLLGVARVRLLVPAELWILGPSPRITVECVAQWATFAPSVVAAIAVRQS